MTSEARSPTRRPSRWPCSHSRAWTIPASAPGRRNGSRRFWGAKSVTITPELKEHLWSALTSLASAPISERTITGLSVLLQSNALKQALQPYTVAGPWGRLLDAESRAARRSGRAGLRDRRADRRGRGACRARLSLPPRRRPARRPADPAHHRRRMARPRRPRLRRAAPGMAEDAAEEECERHLRHPVARGYRWLFNRADDHRKLPDAALPAE